jgi:hypothetical protein
MYYYSVESQTLPKKNTVYVVVPTRNRGVDAGPEPKFNRASTSGAI